jgi:signal peptidase I
MIVASRYLPYIFTLAKTAIFLVVILIIVHFYVATIFIVDGASMSPNLVGGQIVLVNRLEYIFGEPKRGDMVVLRYPGDPEKRTFVKRVVGLPGEKVSIQGGEIYINDRLLRELYIKVTTTTERESAIVIPVNEYYTLGDNRPASNDSRIFKTTPRRFLVGKVNAIIFPFNQIQIVPKVYY